MGCHGPLQGILTQVSNPDLPHCRWILCHLSHQGSPRILEWVAYPFSRGSSQPRNRTRISCIAGRFSTSWATREAKTCWNSHSISWPHSQVYSQRDSAINSQMLPDVPTHTFTYTFLKSRTCLYTCIHKHVSIHHQAQTLAHRRNLLTCTHILVLSDINMHILAHSWEPDIHSLIHMNITLILSIDNYSTWSLRRGTLFKTTVKGNRDCCNREHNLNSIYTRDRWKFIANRVVEGGSDWEISNRNLDIVLANFRCQLACKAFPGVSVSRILEEISIWIGRLSKENCPHQCKWASSSPLRAWIEQKGRIKENLTSLPDW